MACPTETERSFLYSALIAALAAPGAGATRAQGLTPSAKGAAMACRRPPQETPDVFPDARHP